MDIEQKRKELELMNVKAARFGIEIKVLELNAELKRLESHLQIQLKKEKELEEKIKEV